MTSVSRTQVNKEMTMVGGTSRRDDQGGYDRWKKDDYDRQGRQGRDDKGGREEEEEG